MRILTWTSVLAVSIVLIAGCGSGSGGGEATKAATTVNKKAVTRPKLQEMEMTLAGRPNADDAGILVASNGRYFEHEGLELFWRAPAEPPLPIKYTAIEADEVGVAPEPQVLLARENGAPIKVIGTLLSGATSAIIWRKDSGIHDIAELKGKTVGIAGLPYERALLKYVFARAGLEPGDVNVKFFGYNLISALVKHRAAAIFGDWNVEGLELKARGYDPAILPLKSLGVHAYDQMVLIARSRRLRRDPESIKDFMRALALGTAAAKEDPKIAVRTLLENSGGSPLKSTRTGVRETIPMLSQTNRVWPRQWRRFAAWMRSQGMLKKRADVANLLTNAYLPPSAGHSAAGHESSAEGSP